MSIAENLNRIKTCKESIKQAIMDKGVDMTDIPFEGYAAKIAEISGGGTGDTTDYVDISNWLAGSLNGTSITLMFGESGLSNDETTQTMLGEGRYLALEICAGNPSEIWSGEYTPSVNEGFGMQGEFVRGYSSEIWGVEGQDWGTCWKTLSNGETTAERVQDGIVKIIVEGENLVVKLKSSVVNAKAVCPISSIPFTVIDTGYRDDGGGEVVSGDYLQIKQTMTEYSNAETSYLNEYDFAGCVALQTVDLPNIYSIPTGVFYNCNNLSSVNIPNAHSVAYNAFQNCGALTEINLPVCSSVGDTAFYNTGLTELDLPEVVSIGTQSFAGLFNLASVNIPKCKSLAYGAFQNAAITSIDLPMCETVAEYTFSYCGNLATANLPVCLNIGGYAFEGDTPLTTVYAPYCTNIGWNAFNATALSDLDISKIYWCGLGSAEAFNGTPLMNGEGTIKVHKSSLARYQSDFMWSAFADRFVGVGEDDEVLLAFDNGRLYGDTTILGMTYASYLGILDPTSYTEIDLPNCSMFETNQWGGGVSFANYGQLQTVKLPSMTNIPNNTFTMCESLTTVDIANCTGIGSYAFQNCFALTTVNSPECGYISDGAFQTCVNLNSIDLSKCTGIGSVAFDGCLLLTEIDLPECTYLGNNAFSNCGLTSINLPKCGYISPSAFEGCYNLKTITVGTGLEDGNMCFIDGTTFMNCTSIEAIYVPAAQVDAYKSDWTWGQYADKIFAVGTTPPPPPPSNATDWYVVGNFNEWTASDPNTRMLEEDGWYVLRNLTVDGQGVIFAKGFWEDQRHVIGDFTGVGEAVSLAFEGADIIVPAGTYDVYLNSQLDTAYFMEVGQTPF